MNRHLLLTENLHCFHKSVKCCLCEHTTNLCSFVCLESDPSRALLGIVPYRPANFEFRGSNPDIPKLMVIYWNAFKIHYGVMQSDNNKVHFTVKLTFLDIYTADQFYVSHNPPWKRTVRMLNDARVCGIFPDSLQSSPETFPPRYYSIISILLYLASISTSRFYELLKRMTFKTVRCVPVWTVKWATRRASEEPFQR